MMYYGGWIKIWKKDDLNDLDDLVYDENYCDDVLFHDENYVIFCPHDHENTYVAVPHLPDKLEFECTQCKCVFSVEDIVEDMIKNGGGKSVCNINTSELILAIGMKENYRIIFDSLIYKRYRLMYLLFDIITDHLSVDKELLKFFDVRLPDPGSSSSTGQICFILEFIDSWAFFYNYKDGFNFDEDNDDKNDNKNNLDDLDDFFDFSDLRGW